MSWNYRVTKTETDGETIYTIREVYYDESGCISGWTGIGDYANGETLESLRKDFDLMALAFKEPVLDLDEEEKKWGVSGGSSPDSFLLTEDIGKFFEEIEKGDDEIT